MTLSASVLILLSTFEADLGVVLMNTEGPVSREYQTGTLSSSRSLRTSSMILIDKGLARIVSSLPVIVMACKFSVSSSASLQTYETPRRRSRSKPDDLGQFLRLEAEP